MTSNDITLLVLKRGQFQSYKHFAILVLVWYVAIFVDHIGRKEWPSIDNKVKHYVIMPANFG